MALPNGLLLFALWLLSYALVAFPSICIQLCSFFKPFHPIALPKLDLGGQVCSSNVQIKLGCTSTSTPRQGYYTSKNAKVCLKAPGTEPYSMRLPSIPSHYPIRAYNAEKAWDGKSENRTLISLWAAASPLL